MSGATDALYPMDFLEQLNNEGSFLAPTFYSAIGVVATLVIVIIILSVGFCCLARYIRKRNRGVHASSVLINDTAIEETEIDKLVSKDPECKIEGNSSGKYQISKEKESVKDEPVSRYTTIECNQQDSTPLIQREKPSELVQEQEVQQQSTKTSQQENGIANVEDMYATVDEDACKPIAVDRKPDSVTATTGPNQDTAFENDYAEVMTQPKIVQNTYQNFQEISKLKSQTLQHNQGDTGSEEYSRLIHETKSNPRFSVPLLGDYAHIDMSKVKRPSNLGRDLDIEEERPVKNTERSDYETMTDPQPQTPPPLPTPVLDDDIIELRFASYDDDNEGRSSPADDLSKKLLHGREGDYEAMTDPPRTDSPPPLPLPQLEGDSSKQEKSSGEENNTKISSSQDLKALSVDQKDTVDTAAALDDTDRNKERIDPDTLKEEMAIYENVGNVGVKV